jgi:hypothetical protein
MGQFCKKIRGKIHYFGWDKQGVLRQYHEQTSVLDAAFDDPCGDRVACEARGVVEVQFLHEMLPIEHSVPVWRLQRDPADDWRWRD